MDQPIFFAGTIGQFSLSRLSDGHECPSYMKFLGDGVNFW